MFGSLFYLNNDNLLHDPFQGVDRLGLATSQVGPVFLVPNPSHKFVAGLGLRSLIPALFCAGADSLQPGWNLPRVTWQPGAGQTYPAPCTFAMPLRPPCAP